MTSGTIARCLRRLADRVEDVFGPDPGLIRLRAAWRTTIAGAVTLATPYFLSAGDKKSGFMVMSLAFMAAMVASTAVTDPTRWGQTATIALMEIPAIGAVALSAFLHPWGPVGGIVFVLLTGLCVWARRWVAAGLRLRRDCVLQLFRRRDRPPASEPAPATRSRSGDRPRRDHSAQVRPPSRSPGKHPWSPAVSYLASSQARSRAVEGPPERARARCFRPCAAIQSEAEIAKIADAHLLARAQIEKLLPDGERQAKLQQTLFDVHLAAEEVIRESDDVEEPRVRAEARELIDSLAQALDEEKPVSNSTRRDEPLLAELGRLQEAVNGLFDSLGANSAELSKGSWRERA